MDEFAALNLQVQASFRRRTGIILDLQFLKMIGLLDSQSKTCLEKCRENYVETLLDLIWTSVEKLTSFGINNALAKILKIQTQMFLKNLEDQLKTIDMTASNFQMVLPGIDEQYLDDILDGLWKVYIDNFYELFIIIKTEKLDFSEIMPPQAANQLITAANEHMIDRLLFLNISSDGTMVDTTKLPFRDLPRGVSPAPDDPSNNTNITTDNNNDNEIDRDDCTSDSDRSSITDDP